MTEKHTQGEWKVTTDGQKVTSILDRNDANGFNNVCSINEHVEEREANAKLIASAPALLKALKEIEYRATGLGQAPNYTHETFYNESLAICEKAIKEATE